MKYENQYIDYLIENVKSIDTNLIDDYFLNKIDFSELTEKLDVTKYDVLSFNKFVKSIKIDKLY